MNVNMDDVLALLGAKEVEINRLRLANKSLYDRLKQVESMQATNATPVDTIKVRAFERDN